MKFSILVSACVISAAVGAALPVLAETPGRGSRGAAKAAATPGEVASLEQAYTLLHGADHDYDGHRVKAMHAIAEACRLLGSPIVEPGERGRGAASHPTGTTSRPGEPEGQGTSDAQLKQALTIVQQVLTGIAAGTQPAVVTKLNEAVTELNTALAIK